MAPRTGARRKAQGDTPPAAENAKARPSAGHNTDLSEDQLLAYIARHDQADAAVETAQAALKAANKARSNLRQVIKSHTLNGNQIKLKNFDAELERREMTRFEQRDDIEQRSMIGSVLGNVTWEEADLFAQDKHDDTVKDAADWEAAGYAAGLRLVKPDKEMLERLRVPPEFQQDVLRGHDRGTERVMHALKTGKPGENPPPGLDDGDVRRQAEQDFRADNPDVKLPGDAGAQAEAGENESPPEADDESEMFGGEAQD